MLRCYTIISDGHLSCEPMHDSGHSHLTQSLALCNEGLAIVQHGAVLCHQWLVRGQVVSNLLVAPGLHLRVQGQVEDTPAQGGGGGVRPRTKHVQADHRQL